MLCLPSVRQSLISGKALAVFKKVLPAMSQTEKEALEAGTVWWEAELFKGKPDWKKLHNIQAPKLSAEEQAFLDGPVNEVCAMVSDYQVTHELADLPPEVWTSSREEILRHDHQKTVWRLRIFSLCTIFGAAKLTGVSGVLSSTVGVPNSLGPVSCCNITVPKSRKTITYLA